MTTENKMDMSHDHGDHEPTDEPPEMVEEMFEAEPHPAPEPKLETAMPQLPIVELRPATEAQIDMIDARTESLMDLLKPTMEAKDDPLVDAIMRILAEVRLIREDQRQQGQMLSLLIQRQEFLGGQQLPTRTPQHQTQ